MSEDVVVKKTEILEDFIKLPDFDKLQGHGGSFLVVPLDQYKIFSKEQFTEDQKMFANAALEYAVNRMKPLKDEAIQAPYNQCCWCQQLSNIG